MRASCLFSIPCLCTDVAFPALYVPPILGLSDQFKDMPLKFVNRDEQVLLAGVLCLTNLSHSGGGDAGDRSYKHALLTAVQTFGAGKTYFGRNFLSRLFDPSLADIRRSCGIRDELPATQRLRRALYVFVALDHASEFESQAHKLSAFIYCGVIRALELEKNSDGAAAVTKQFASLSPRSTTPQIVVQICSRILDRCIFLHLDEIQCWKPEPRDKTAPVATNPFVFDEKARLAAFYTLWREVLDPIIKAGNLVYCSGRAPDLFLVGRDLGKHFDASSPGPAYPVLLGALRKDHIHEILADFVVRSGVSWIRRLSAHDLDTLAEAIFATTRGGPRLVAIACYMLQYKLKPERVPLLAEDHYWQFTKALIEYAHSIRITAELDPFQNIALNHRSLLNQDQLVEMVFCLAAYRIPLVPSAKTSLFTKYLQPKDQPYVLEVLSL